MKGNFSEQAEQYARYRPLYPASLYAEILSLTTGRLAAWDCACGNGQVARELVNHFTQVYATDMSAEQLAYAPTHDRIQYRQATAQQSGLPSSSCDLICVAQALHWFAAPEFYKEVARVGTAQATLAIWGYALPVLPNSLQDTLLYLYEDVLDGCWDPARRHIDAEYHSLEIPFTLLTQKKISTILNWSKEHFMGYLDTWSALRSYRRQTGTDPLPGIGKRIAELWSTATPIPIQFPFFVLVFRLP